APTALAGAAAPEGRRDRPAARRGDGHNLPRHRRAECGGQSVAVSSHAGHGRYLNLSRSDGAVCVPVIVRTPSTRSAISTPL
ncbi:MAG: hypothetical protein AVDCRST_MAG88-3008, partial [uncultured Thermomicrobiales bacterium]